MARLASRQLLWPDGTLAPGVVEIERGRITSVQAGGDDAPPGILAPAFIDLQVNGHADVDVATADGPAWDRMDGLLRAQGVGTWCPTLVSAPLESYAAPLARIAAAARRPDGPDPRPQIAGVHLEGPFLGGAPGAHRREHLVPVDGAWLAALPEVVRVLTLAPEAEGAAGAVAALRARGVLVALGHSTATYAQAEAAADLGAALVTHLFNGMAPFHHRQPGLVGAALTDPRLAVSVIADGVHLDPVTVGLVFRIKGPARVALVTDAVAWAGDGLAGQRVSIAGGAARLADGTLAGSVLTMDAAVRGAVAAGVAVADALTAASSTPAGLLGLTDRGRLAAGQRADLVALDTDLHVAGLWLGGNRAPTG